MTVRYVTSLSLLVGLLLLWCVGAERANAIPFGFVLGNGGTTLHQFDVDDPGNASVVSITLNGTTASLDAIDFRPLDGVLYGYDDVTDTYYTVDKNTGALTTASIDAVPTATDQLDIDFNPTIDRMRTVTALDTNIVYNPNDGSTTLVTPLFYDVGDLFEGTNPFVVGNAYTNNFDGATETTQFVLDATLNSLATLANNAGTLSTVGVVTLNGEELDFDPEGGFDIFTDGMGNNTAFAALNVDGLAGLYSIDLMTAEASFLGDLPSEFGTINGLALTIPEPSTIALSGIGLIAAFGILRRRTVSETRARV